MNYFIVGLPRSRTAWLSVLLTGDGSFCFHEGLQHCESVNQLKALSQNVPRGTVYVGDADPSICFYAHQVYDLFPDARWVFIQRNRIEAARAEWQASVESGVTELEGLTLEQVIEATKEADRNLELLWAQLTLEHKQKLLCQYWQLDNYDTIRNIWAFCCPGLEFPEERYQILKNLRITQIFKNVWDTMKGPPPLHESILAKEPAHA